VSEDPKTPEANMKWTSVGRTFKYDSARCHPNDPIIFFDAKMQMDDTGTRGTMYGGFRLYEIARNACRASRREHANFEAEQVMIAIVFAAASVEAYLQEYVDGASTIGREELSEEKHYEQIKCFVSLARDYERTQQEAIRILKAAEITFCGQPPDQGAKPYQGFDQLMRLRNHVLHLKPEPVEFENGARVSPVHKLVVGLESVGVIPQEQDPTETVDRSDSRLFTSRVAQFCCNTATKVVKYAAGIAPDSFGQHEQWRAESWVQIEDEPSAVQ